MMERKGVTGEQCEADMASRRAGETPAILSYLSRRDVLKLGGAAAALLMMRDTLIGETFMANTSSTATTTGGLVLRGAFEKGQYVLPKLPYAADALEPLYDRQTVEIHHDKHHAAYVKGLNTAMEKLQDARQKKDFSAIRSLCDAVAFNGSGHMLHTLFWHSMKPGGGTMPADMDRALTEDFGSSQAAQEQLATASKEVQGSGWAVLAFEPTAQKMLILQAEKHQNLTVWGVVPLLVCDVWEHAYYLKFQNNRAGWVDNFMKLANWEFALGRLMAAKQC